MEKMTNVKALYFVLNNYEEMPEDVRLKLEGMVATLEKKSANRKPTKVQEQNNELKDAILANLTSEPKTVSEIIAIVPELAGMNTQKVTPLMYQLEGEGKVTKVADKKKSLFCLA